MAEQARVAIRAIRRDANKAIDQEKEQGALPEDDAEKCKEKVQELTDEYNGRVDRMLAEKNREVMET
jgi:ribosome recycling factor